MTSRRAGFLVLLVAAVRLVAAPPEPIQKPVKLLGLGENVDREFAKLTDIGITPSLTYYGVFQGNPVGGIQQRTAYSQLILFGVELNFEKLVGLTGGSLTISGAQAMGENLSSYIGNINTVSEAFATPDTVLFYQLNISLLPLMGFAGTTWQGLVPGRDRDQLSLTYLASDFSRNHTVSGAGHGGHRPTVEHVLGAGYAINISDNYTVQPDIQYVVRPNGVSDVRNSLVIGIQLIASY